MMFITALFIMLENYRQPKCVTVERWFSTDVILTLGGHLEMSGFIFGCHNLKNSSLVGGGQGCR